MSKHLTDEQRQMVADNHNLIYSFLNKYNLPDDEWYDVAVFGLINAAMTYNGSAAFSTYAYRCMYNEVRNERIHRERYFPENLSLNYEYQSDAGDTYTLADIWSDGSDFAEAFYDEDFSANIIKFFESRLRTDGQRQQFALLLDGKNSYEISKICGVSHQQVYLLRKKLLKEYHLIFDDSGSIRRVEVGEKIRIGNNPYKYKVEIRDDRYIICTRKYNTSRNKHHIIIDLKDRVYGQDNGEVGRYNTAKMCRERLLELQSGKISIATESKKKLDFFVA